MRSRFRAVAIIVFLSPAIAQAGGEDYPDNGTQALSRGGAFTAKADDLSALEYNVAGLAWVRGTRLMLSSNFVFESASFQRFGNYPTQPAGVAGKPYDGQPFPSVSNGNGPRIAPFFVAASDFGLRQWTFAVGVYGPSAYGRTEFPTTVTTKDGIAAPAPNRYDMESEDLLIAYPTAAVAWKPTDYISFGAAFHWTYSNLKFHNTVYLPGAQCGIENTDCDYDTNIDVSQSFSPAWSVGVLGKPSEHVMLGLSFRSSVDIDAKGTVTVAAGPLAPVMPAYEPGRNNADAELITGRPAVVRAGGRYIWGSPGAERGDLELDFTYERWSSVMKEFDVKVTNLTPQPRTIRIPHNYDDTYSVRLGYSHTWDALTGRAGAYFDSAASPNDATRLDFMSWEHIGLTAGVGYRLASGWTFDVGAAYVYMPQRQVCDSSGMCSDPSVGRQLDALGGSSNDAQHTIIGNGQYNASYVILTAGFQYSFDPFKK
jgi:long-chain fatty acid transport protein